MKTKILIPAALLVLLCATTQAQIPMTDNTAPPGWAYYNQTYLPGVVVEGTNTIGSPSGYSGNNDASTYVSDPDRQSKAQSFTTGPSPLGYTLQSFTFQQLNSGTNPVINNGTFFLLNNGDNVLVRVGTLPGPQATAYTAILTTNATYTGTTYNTGGTASALGIYFTLNFSGALPTLAANTTYFVEVMATVGDHFELNNTATNSTDPVNFPLLAPLYTNGAALIGNTTAGLDATGNFSVPAQGGEFAFVAALAAVGAPTVVATANPSIAVTGQTFKVTATITPGFGTLTNVSVDLSGIAGSSAATLVRSNTANVYTNTFTVSAAALLGSTNLTVTTMQNTQPLVGAARVAFTVISASAPAIVQDTTPASIATVYQGQGLTFSATFSGVQPISYNWQFSPDYGSTWINISNATTTRFTIPSAGLGDSGMYQLQASNAFGITVSAPTILQVNTGNPRYIWSAPISFSFAGLNADQILTNFPATNKVAGALVAKNGGSPIVVTNSSADSPIVFAGAGAWASLSGGAGYFTGANTNLTGNANFNTCLNDGYNDNATHAITMNGLIVGQRYQVQLFGLDDRSGLSPVGSSRFANWQDPADNNDIGQTFAMADNVYMLGTFTASSNVMTIQQNILSSGNFNCLVLRTVGWNPPPYITLQPKGGIRYFGDNATLSASAAGDATIPSPTIIYQWQAGPTNGPYTNLLAGAKYGGTTTATLTISNATFSDAIPAYVLVAVNGGGSITSSVANIFVISRTLVGQWVAGSNSLADVSGYSPAGTHDGFTVGGTTYSFSSDVPPGWSGQSLSLSAGNTGIAIGNSSTLDGATYTNTFDDDINTAMTITCWAKGTPAGWNPWVSKYGENGLGWQLRVNNSSQPCWTIRGTGGNEDMASSTATPADGVWHHYAGTYSTLTGVRSLYVDGVLAVTQTNQGPLNASAASHLVIGARDGGGNAFGNYFTGNIYDVRVYDYDLTSSQVAQLAVLPDPVILGQPPTNTDAFLGYTAQILATVKGTAPLTNQWKFNGTNLVDGVHGGAIFIGSTSNVLTIYAVTTNIQGVYTLALSNSLGSTVSSNSILTVLLPVPPSATNLVGAWLAGATNFNEVSGYTPAHTHDGGLINGGNTNYNWTSDVPPGAPAGAMSLYLNNSGLVISNTSTADTNVGQAYVSTFDTGISSQFSVTFWAKGAPGGGSWNPWISKYGENGVGWQYRIGTDAGRPVWTVRDNSSGAFIDGAMGPSWSRGGDQDDMHASFVVANTDIWHFYVGTYDVTTGIRKLYVDGVYGGGESGNTQYTTAPSAHVAIGARDSGGGSFGNYYTGTIYGVRIYNTALSTAQVLSFVTAPPPPAPAFSVTPAVTTGPNGKQFVLTWNYGTLLQATNIAGPWTSTGATSPHTVIISNAPDMFFKLSNP
jgi:hypothetical protein